MDGTEALRAALVKLGLTEPADEIAVTPLTGGVSCDIFKVETPSGTICVKQALAQLRVATEWLAPVERSGNEVRWLKLAEKLGAPLAPRVLAQSDADNLFVMSFLDPLQHRNWKGELAQGRIDADFAAQVGAQIGRMHAATADDQDVARAFATDEMFHALRIEPYLLHTAGAHPDLADRLTAIAALTQATRRALVHGDASPKNILVGPNGPVFLDAECAWFGDPAFDLAFCLTHLILKGVWLPQHRAACDEAFEALHRAYMAHVNWEPPAGLDQRAADLLAAFLLARIDGKSPVEYLTSEDDKAFVRRAARQALLARPASPLDVLTLWIKETEAR